MDGDPKNAGETQESDGALNKSGLSRRRLLNIMRSIGVGVGAAVIIGRDTIVAFAQQITGVLGTPTATTTIEGAQLPPPPAKFGGVINETAKDSKPWWPPRVVPPKGAPNVLLIMTDDQGYGVSGTFGGVIPTPALDRIAKAGLRYTQFHSTALCSPTRAALITGRNHHEVGFGVIAELSTGFPGYDSYIGRENATIGKILKDNGYATSWFGKNHNTPGSQYAGPYDQWPSGMGFEYFYGFMGGETDQWTPYLFRDHTQVFPWVDKPGYNLITDMADEAIQHMRMQNATAPDQPFFVYYVPGGSHSPHQPTQDGSTSSRASSTWVGTPCEKKSSPTRNVWGSSLRRRS
jgi:phosphoglycerol transferase MdoB-like AlkP superfamily enzyme